PPRQARGLRELRALPAARGEREVRRARAGVPGELSSVRPVGDTPIRELGTVRTGSDGAVREGGPVLPRAPRSRAAGTLRARRPRTRSRPSCVGGRGPAAIDRRRRWLSPACVETFGFEEDGGSKPAYGKEPP